MHWNIIGQCWVSYWAFIGSLLGYHWAKCWGLLNIGHWNFIETQLGKSMLNSCWVSIESTLCLDISLCNFCWISVGFPLMQSWNAVVIVLLTICWVIIDTALKSTLCACWDGIDISKIATEISLIFCWACGILVHLILKLLCYLHLHAPVPLHITFPNPNGSKGATDIFHVP